MIEIALLEDLAMDSDRFSRCLKETMAGCRIHVFKTMEAFLEDREHYDFILADVFIGKDMVFDYKEILSAKADYLMFASVLSDNSYRAYMPKSVGFIYKQLADDEVKKALAEKYNEYLSSRARIYTRSGAIDVNARKVMYLEKYGKNVVAHFEGGREIDMGRISLPRAAKILMDICQKANRSMYVNPAYITRIDGKEIRMADGQWTKSSPGFHQELMKAFVNGLA